MNSIVNKDLGEALTPPDMSGVKQEKEGTGGTISIGNFSISPMATSRTEESLKEGLLKESKDSGLNPS